MTRPRLPMSGPSQLRIGVDIGGTFTDFVVFDPGSGEIESFKLLSTPADPSKTVLEGLKFIFSKHPSSSITVIHGSTVATNALLERKGARIALVTTRGFRDVLQIGRQNRPELYSLSSSPPPALIPDQLRFEIDERITSTGEVLQEIDAHQAQEIISQLKTQNVQSVAVCFLFSFLQPRHEKWISRVLRESDFLVSASHEILPEYREYERFSTTAVNAYVSPALDSYLSQVETELNLLIAAQQDLIPKAGRSPLGVHLRVMQSNGGMISPQEARRYGVRCILSGPAGGVVGCEYIARSAIPSGRAQKRKKELKAITFDMGGTSTDVSLIDSAPRITTEAVVSGHPIHIPVLDIHTIGAGGGSIARRDPGGALRVGPESAGADPGPACYGRGGDLPTVTDANVVLGRLAPEYFLGGQMPLDPSQAWRVLRHLGDELGLDPIQAALGIVQVVNAHMERALRVISVERGYDPRHFFLLSFGGAGSLHAAELARSLGIPRLLVPPLASTLSAFGMLSANVIKDYTQTVMLPDTISWAELEKKFLPLVQRGREDIHQEGTPEKDIHIEQFLDIRYLGQSYELSIPFRRTFISDFHRHHQAAYGYANPGTASVIVNLRVRAVGRITPPRLPTSPRHGRDPAQAFLETRPVTFPQGTLETSLYQAEKLKPGNRLSGPAVVVRADTTILLGPSDQARVDHLGNLDVEVSP